MRENELKDTHIRLTNILNTNRKISENDKKIRTAKSDTTIKSYLSKNTSATEAIIFLELFEFLLYK